MASVTLSRITKRYHEAAAVLEEVREVQFPVEEALPPGHLIDHGKIKWPLNLLCC